MSKKPRLKRDWIGKTVQLNKEIRNGYLVLPVGTRAVVTDAHNKANLVGEPCKCCRVSIRISRVPWEDLEIIEKDPNGV